MWMTPNPNPSLKPITLIMEAWMVRLALYNIETRLVEASTTGRLANPGWQVIASRGGLDWAALSRNIL